MTTENAYILTNEAEYGTDFIARDGAKEVRKVQLEVICGMLRRRWKALRRTWNRKFCRRWILLAICHFLGQFVDWNGWLRIDEEEKRRGAMLKKEREKMTDIGTMLELSNSGWPRGLVTQKF